MSDSTWQALLALPSHYVVRQTEGNWQIERFDKNRRSVVVTAWFALLFGLVFMLAAVAAGNWLLLLLILAGEVAVLRMSNLVRTKRLKISAEPHKLRIEQAYGGKRDEYVFAWHNMPTIVCTGCEVCLISEATDSVVTLDQFETEQEAQQVQNLLIALESLYRPADIASEQTTLLPIEGLIPGISHRNDLLRLGRHPENTVRQLDGPHHFSVTTPNASFWLELTDDVINKIVFLRRDQLPTYWQTLGLHRQLSFQAWRSRIRQHGFKFRRMDHAELDERLDHYHFDQALILDRPYEGVVIRMTMRFRFDTAKNETTADTLYTLSLEKRTR